MTKTKRILVPTDFTIKSLRIVIDYLSDTTDENIELILVHGRKASDSITELLGFSNDYYIEKAYHEDFLTACQIIKHRFENKITEIYSDMISSKNDNYIRNYLKGNRIDMAVLPTDFSFSNVFPMSFSVAEPLQKNCHKLGIPIMQPTTAYLSTEKESSLDSMDSIFFRKDLKNATY